MKTIKEVYDYANNNGMRVFKRKNLYFLCKRGVPKNERFLVKNLVFIEKPKP